MLVKNRKLFWPMILLISLTSTALALVSVRSKTMTLAKPERRNAEPRKPAEGVDSRSSPAQLPISGNFQNAQMEAELVVAGTDGFEPSQISRPAGEFLLIVDNRSGLDQIQVRLERVVGRERLQDVGLTRRAFSWNTLLRLPPGDYVVTEASHPDWVCRLTLTPNR